MKQSFESVDRVRELLDRNLQAVFGENDHKRRRRGINELRAENGVLYVPPGVIAGRGTS